MKEFKKLAYPFIEVSDEEWEFFSSHFVYSEFKKGSLLLQQGETENYLTFLEDGLTRSFFKFNEKDRTLRFTFSGNFVSSYKSFILQAPSEVTIEALSDCKCWRISYENIQKCYNRTMEGNKLGRVSAEFLYIVSSTREISMLTKTPEQRYLELFHTNPEWFFHIPMKHVASYLGITLQALSRIRARIS